MRIDWRKVWRRFDSWLDKKDEECRCDKCGRLVSYEHPEWPDQQKQIARIVNSMLREKAR